MPSQHLSSGMRVEFTRSPGRFGTIVSGPYTDKPWGSPDDPTYLVQGDNGIEGYRSPAVLAPLTGKRKP